jgi:hypothetical protein
MMRPITILYVSAKEDESLRQKLEKHLTLLEQQGLIEEWNAQQILAGRDQEESWEDAFTKASLVLLLISADFFASTLCREYMQRATEKQKSGEVQVIPILLRPVDRKGALFAHLQVLPRDGEPITSWPNEDEAFKEVAEGIRDVIEGVPLFNQMQSQPAQGQGIFHGQVTINNGDTHVNTPQHRKNIAIIVVSVILLLVSLIVTTFLIASQYHTSLACDAAPTLTEPVDGQTLNTRTVRFTWEAPQGCLPEGYTVRISADRDPEARPWIVDTGWAPTDYTYTCRRCLLLAYSRL